MISFKKIKNEKIYSYLAFIVFISLLVFANTLFFDYVWDDTHQIKYNRSLRDIKNIYDFFLSPIPEMPMYYRPIFMLSLLIDYQIWGPSPFGFHLTNILLNIFSNILIFIVVERIFKSRAIAFIAALIFAVHPSHSSSVSYISARNELLCGFFVLHAFSFYTKYKMERNKRIHLLLSLTFYILALLSKEMAITMPFLVLLYEYAFHKEDIRRDFKHIFLFIFTTFIYFLIRLLVLEAEAQSFPLLWRLATFSKVLLYDLFMLFFPFFHKAFHKVEILEGFSNFLSLLYLLCVLLILALTIFLSKYDRRLFFPFTWIIISLIPATTIITFIYPTLVAERYLYIPSMGLAMFLAVFYYDIYNLITKKFPRKALFLKIAFGLITLVFLVLTFERNFEYKDNLTLWKTAKEDEPYEPYVIDKLAQSLIEKKYYAQAEVELKRLEMIDYNNPQVHQKLGNLYKRWGRYDLAEAKYLLALKFAPDDNLVLDDLADLYKRKGDLDRALSIFLRSIEIEPKDSNVNYEIGEILLQKNDLFQAEKFFLNAIAYNPDHHLAFSRLGEIYMFIGRIDLAKEMFKKALVLEPENEDYKNKLLMIGQ